LRALINADFARLFAASAISNLGDGVTMVAAPLLVATLTDDPAAVALAAFAQQLPWLLFALISGAWADRLDRRRLVVAVNAVRAVALAGLAAAVATGAASVGLVLVIVFVLGTGETLADTASSAFVPAIVPVPRLPTANAWLGGAGTVANGLAAKPLGAWLFAGAAALPFAVDAISFATAAILVAGIGVLSQAGRPSAPEPGRPRASLRADIGAGLRWLRGHRLLRTLAITMAFGNVIYCAAFATFVLYARDRLGLAGTGFGVLLTAFAIGGLLGTLLAPRLLRRVSATLLLRAGLFVEVALHGTLAVTTSPLVAGGMIVVFGVHTVVWGVVVTTIRQRVVPSTMLGRVTGVHIMLDLGGAALGSLIGGVLAQAYGIVSVFGGATVAMALLAAVAWRPLSAAATFRSRMAPSLTSSG
jgi:MFS family permease